MERIYRVCLSGIFFASILTQTDVHAQTFSFAEDASGRGYYDRPWQRYEAEPDYCVTDGEFLLPPEPYSQEPLQSEASNQTALSLREKGESVSWTIDRPGRGVTLRFSLPDSEEGTGRKGALRLSVSDGREPVDLELDSYWAWQYTVIAHSSEKYPDNTPSADKFARMRFDEVTCLLEEDIPSGATVTLTKACDDDMAYTIDFMELEPVAPPVKPEDIEADNLVVFEGGELSGFILSNGGKTIYLPQGRYSVSRMITLNTPGTRVIGAGMWYTTVNFTASSDNRSTYSARGFHCSQSNCELRGMSVNTVNNKRYFQNNPSYQVGKGLNGSWGAGSRISDLRIEHFECGGWITGARELIVEHCRMRNNYADGINLANNSTACRVSHCSFRNNGDDDMASWSTGSYATDNEFSYNTAENNWRASSLGFFGGCRQKAHHIAVYDGLEAGVRVTCDFPGTGFADSGEISLSDISIYRCGAQQGIPGQQGGFWGGSDGALELRAGYAYDLKNVRAERVDIYDSRKDAVTIESQSGKRVLNLELHDINIYRVEGYAYGVNIATSVRGNGRYSGISAEGVQEPYMSTVPPGFDFKDVSGSGIREIGDNESDCVDCVGHRDKCCFDLKGCPVEESRSGIYLEESPDGGYRKVLFYER